MFTTASVDWYVDWPTARFATNRSAVHRSCAPLLIGRDRRAIERRSCLLMIKYLSNPRAIGQNGPQFCVLYAKKYTSLKKAHHCWLWQFWLIWAMISGSRSFINVCCILLEQQFAKKRQNGRWCGIMIMTKRQMGRWSDKKITNKGERWCGTTICKKTKRMLIS